MAWAMRSSDVGQWATTQVWPWMGLMSKVRPSWSAHLNNRPRWPRRRTETVCRRLHPDMTSRAADGRDLVVLDPIWWLDRVSPSLRATTSIAAASRAPDHIRVRQQHVLLRTFARFRRHTIEKLMGRGIASLFFGQERFAS